MNFIGKLFFIYLFLCNFFVLSMPNDEIDFFNVGQGHAVLINKVGKSQTTNQPYTPLLIDAGSTSLPYTPQEQYIWKEEENFSVVNKISSRIIYFWKNSNKGMLEGGEYKLNIIITHADEDHRGFVPLVLHKLEEKRHAVSFSFMPFLFLGGEQNHYEKGTKKSPSFLSSIREEYPRVYSSTFLGMHFPNTLDNFLNSSGCITHLFCPKGIKSDPNRWSIITRIQIDGISAILTGDANQKVKEQMISKLHGHENDLLSDILLVPHHGAESTYQEVWDHAVNPMAIIIGSSPNGGLLKSPNNGYRHPRGETLLEFLRLFQGRGRIWDQSRPHGIQYYCEESIHEQIQKAIHEKKGSFERVPNTTIDTQTQFPSARWHLVWSNIPIYTLWTTGSLFFSKNIQTPQFIDAPNGMMGYVALSSPEYYFSPDQRPQNRQLIQLIDILLQDGEGNSDTVTNIVTSFPLDHIEGTERESILLTDNLNLYENRANMVRAIWEIPQNERGEIIEQVKDLTKKSTKNFSEKYRILKSLMQLDQRRIFTEYLKKKIFLSPKDNLALAKVLEVFCVTPLDQAQEIVGLLQTWLYPTFESLTPRERESILKMIEQLSKVERTNRTRIFEVAFPFIMPFSDSIDPHSKFHDVNDNANLIKVFAESPTMDLLLFSEQIKEAREYLTADSEEYLYKENKFFFMKALLSVSAAERTNYLKGLLPMIKRISELKYESWELSVVAAKLASIYGQPNYPLRLEYINKLLSNSSGRQGEEFLGDTFSFWFDMSQKYAEKKSPLNLPPLKKD